MLIIMCLKCAGMHDLIQNMSPGRKMSGDGELEIEEGTKFPGASPYSSCQKKMDMEDGGVPKKQQMPPASVMTRLILIMVWRKLIRNPNTYSSLIGLAWSLVSYKYMIDPFFSISYYSKPFFIV